MSRARKTKNPKRRRRKRKKRLLREYCARIDQQAAQTGGAEQDGAEPSTTALPSDKDAPGPKTASTADQKTSSSESKQRFKPRKVPDRDYYPRPGKMERQYLGFQRRVTALIDEKIAKGSATLDKWKRDAGAFMEEFQRKEKIQREELELDLGRMRVNHREMLDMQARQIGRLKKKFEEING
ncbi:uncharacterized protein NECHADRAFT_86014 [Fusarium vanettenii 77-13-4]|uniref:Uncharacterized protein n=1 Tax=Fusarium vanettenii (strain ATCC MYA-4622 / CBS 123669 / FGSC 9596 / NRRL 45880 / 77-13-4) TaxID=660122 RepID=C7Z239_FUSV7|nr:uncharacterized protein NECHADRAFT_86014 [Fusarium vanettenii 77-13-4]EEU41934.1 predicted protein [Fusarium vanettenii 77-13-4]